MITPSERRAAQRRLAREIKEGTYQKSNVGARARHAATIGTSNPADLRADLEERALRRAQAHFGDRRRFNKESAETRIKGGVIDGSGKKGGEADYYPLAKLNGHNIILHDGKVRKARSSKPFQVKGATNDQLQKMITMSADEWEKNAKRGSKRGLNRFFYH